MLFLSPLGWCYLGQAIARVRPPPAAATGHLQMASSGSVNLTYINNVAESVTMTAGTNASHNASADFRWNVNGGGDAFAWANLHDGDTMAFRFLRPAGGTGL